jgi:hypothetical protein
MPDAEFVLGLTGDTSEREVLPGIRIQMLGTGWQALGGDRQFIYGARLRVSTVVREHAVDPGDLRQMIISTLERTSGGVCRHCVSEVFSRQAGAVLALLEEELPDAFTS